jgi:putative aldouronate transport system substrate-binding protein
MEETFMKLMGKTSLVILCLIITGTLVVCKEDNQGETKLTETGAMPEKEFPGGWKPTTNYSEKVDFTAATVSTIEGYNYTDGDPLCKWESDLFNYTLDLTTLTFDNWSERLRIWISSGDMPDTVVIDYKHPDMATWVEQELLKKFPDNWKERWPNLARVYEKTSLGPQMEKMFNGTYMIPRARFDKNLPGLPLPGHSSFFYRKDWSKAVGFPVKTAYTIPEIIEYGRLVKEKDPGKLGTKLLPLSFRPDWAMRVFLEHNSTYYNAFYKAKDGTFTWGATSNDTLRGLKLYYKAFAAGILNPEFYVLKDFEDYDQFRISCVSGGVYGQTTLNRINENFTQFEKNSGLSAEENIGIATVLGDDGYYHQQDIINFWGCHVFNPEISDAKFERWMDMLDFSCTDAGFIMRALGFEGEDWKREADGSIVSLVPPGVQLFGAKGKYPSRNHNWAMAKLFDDFDFDNPAHPKFQRDLLANLYAERINLSAPETFTFTDWDVYCYDSSNIRKAVLDYQAEYANLVTRAKSEVDLENLWRTWIETQKPLIQPVLDELNDKYSQGN